MSAETKTKDNVFVTVHVSVQYQAIRDKIYEAFYTLEDPHSQMRAYVFDVIRSTLPNLTLDQAFESKDDMAHAVKEQLSHVMASYGFTILQSLVTDLIPDARVRDAMNEINASKRLKEAAMAKAEAEKVVLVKAAEADAEAKYLSGIGVARQRKAIVDGLRDSIVLFSEHINGTSPKDVMDLLLLTQYFDMLKDIGNNANTQTIFLPSSEQNAEVVRNAMMEASRVR
jgi:regulator of protease activity HflC (stomatin/prohibitin superfamily)